VRGTQVRVLEEDGDPAAGALVYHLPAGRVQGALPFSSTEPLRTNSGGYLGGRGQMAPGDRLVALWPAEPAGLSPELSTQIGDTLRFYHTSAMPTLSGLDAKPLPNLV
jgi:hypothetical protein